MIDHIGLSVTDYERSKAFYLAALARSATSCSWRFPRPAS